MAAPYIRGLVLVLLVSSAATLGFLAAAAHRPIVVDRGLIAPLYSGYAVGVVGRFLHITHVFIYRVGEGPRRGFAEALVIVLSNTSFYVEPARVHRYVYLAGGSPPVVPEGILWPEGYNRSVYSVLINTSSTYAVGTGETRLSWYAGYLAVVVDALYYTGDFVELDELIPPRIFYPGAAPGNTYIRDLYLRSLNDTRYAEALGYIAARGHGEAASGIRVYSETLLSPGPAVLARATGILLLAVAAAAAARPGGRGNRGGG